MKITDIAHSDKLPNRFWSKVDTSGDCWEWMGCKKFGYGRIGCIINNEVKQPNAHRIAYLLKHGEIPDELDCLHTCDNPACCNPAHLWLGTQTDNMRDALKKGRRTSETNNMAKLTREQVEIIRARDVLGDNHHWLAAEYGVRPGEIWRIVHNKRWGD